MPELPEVERARKLIFDSCRGYKIKSVEAKEDKIIYTGGSDHNEFAKELEGRTITGCERKGKIFWMTLSGEGRLPVMHFGMTGMVQFYKFVLELEPQPGSVSDEPRELAFIDARRLARLRLVASPVAAHPPVSALGFDPVLTHPSFDEFRDLIAKKKGTVKGMIMDQGFSAGVGNWVADEILYHSRIHPACPVPALSDQNIIDLHHNIREIPLTAVEVDADSRQFPEDWLFRWRWGKGKKQTAGSKKSRVKDEEKVKDEAEESGEDIKPAGKDFLSLPDGKPATIGFIEVGGRTTAVVEELQKMPEGVEIKAKVSKGGKGSRSKKRKGSDDGSEGGTSTSTLSGDDEAGSAEETATPVKVTTPRQKAAAARKVKTETEEAVSVPKKGSSAKRKADKANGAVAVKAEATTPSKKTRKTASGVASPSNPKSTGRAKGRSSRSSGRRAKRELGRDGPKPSVDSSDLSDAPE